MAEKLEIYKCEICGNIVEVLHGGAGQLVCCGEPMTLLTAKSEDEGQEKHVPVIEKTDSGYKITVGSTLHPMTEKHFIEWIQIIIDGKLYMHFLSPGDDPIAEFEVQGENLIAREYCNIHGLWMNKS